MPPHCDSLDGPIVVAARQALNAKNVDLVLPFVPAEGEEEVQAVFDAVVLVRQLGHDAQEVADLLFFETVVRLHRAGEGAPYTGLKPAGLDVGPVIPLAEKAIQQGSAEQLGDFLAAVLKGQLERRLEEVRKLEPQHLPSVGAARRYVQAMLGFQVYSHDLYRAMLANGHHDGTDHAAHHG